MSNEKKKFKVQIGDREYTIIGKSSSEHMKTVTNIMNKQLKQLKHLSYNITPEDAAVLLAFNSISDQLKLQNDLDKLSHKNNDDSKDGEF